MHYTSSAVYKKISEETNDPIIAWMTCAISQTSFPIFQSEKILLEKLSLKIGQAIVDFPLPKLCPEIRLLQKLLFINQTKLYNNTCHMSNKKTISRLSPLSWYLVYSNENRSSDARDSLDYGIDIDEEKSVMDHIQHLTRTTPYQDLIGSLSNIQTNATYTNYTSDIADSYLVFDANNVQKSCYSMLILDCNYMIDCLSCTHSENCYECIDSDHIFACFYCQKVVHTKYSWYMTDCQNCDYCLGCVWIQWKKYYILNKEVDKKRYEETLHNLQDPTYKETFIAQWKTLCDQWPRPATMIVWSDKAAGNDIFDSAGVHWWFTIRNAQDISYCYNLTDAQDCYDVFSYGQNANSMYNSVQAWRQSHHIYYSNTIGKWENLLYCIEVKKSKHCFWCVNMRDKEYCIFNKQYTKEAYETIVPKLLQDIKKNWLDWDFLRSDCSPFPYNDTFAALYFPIETVHYANQSQIINQNGVLDVFVEDKDAFISKAWLQVAEWVRRPIWWRNKQQEINIPEGIQLIAKKDLIHWDYTDASILQKAIVCEVSWRPFRIVQIELDFYKKYNLPIPYVHPDLRQEQRMKSRTWLQFYLRTCSKTGEEIISIYSQDVSFPVYSQEVYKKLVYG